MLNKKLFVFTAVIGLCFLMFSCSSARSDRAGNQTQVIDSAAAQEAMEFAASMKIGWNLGNTLEGHPGDLMPHETAWNTTEATSELMEAIAEHGFGAVRIPVTWGQKLHPQLQYNPSRITLTVDEIMALKIDEEWINRVAEVVEYTLDAGMKAIINIHHDGADSHHWLSVKNADLSGSNKEKVDAVFITLWTQIAQKFIDTGEDLIFEGFNELHDGSWNDGNAIQHRRLNELNQIFVDTVRSIGGENSRRYLLVHGYVTRPSVMVSSLRIPNDTVQGRILAGFHYYDPYDFSGNAKDRAWGSKGNPRGWANENHVRSTFNSVKRKFTDNGIPVIIGEYGAVNHRTESGMEYRRYYVEYVTKYAVDCGFVPFYWDNGGFGDGPEKFGLIDRFYPHDVDMDGEAVLEAMMRAAYSDYQLSDIVVP